ncbi:P-loop containing nucleoside triphosphate hydrolase protein [Cokeromyces recurvatus]|uniref:P-loop containing nucleoside triphosphate hydrolase protein n=1 Tax=Cokeromyces recurvatus TaxID=90255 RepID=UPI00221ED495|nr:P-loop containing nucleoside triphosphate hydrolase protein [Cokeromyces recurvatus]KAI7898726.1 P-loop containing nucleoside triphosphate hydrolase protein [Cokeromyces recurvatus]
MQRYRLLNSFLKQERLLERNKLSIRAFSSLATKNNCNLTQNDNTSQLSNRQRFKQIQPPASLYEKLERLGFNKLPKTQRYGGLNKEIAKRRRQIHEPHYSLPLLSFYAGAKQASSFPEETLDEIAFVGRSNVGKSSLINSLAETTVVRTSDKPGLTQQINFFNVGRLFFMVDMPGYGFAFVDEEERRQWRELMETYFSKRKTLKRIFVVLDARHGVKVIDTEFFEMLNRQNIKFQVVLTKSDLMILPNLARRVITVQNDIKRYHNAIQDVIIVSSKRYSGINQFRKEILFLMGHLETKEYYEDIETKKKEEKRKSNKKKLIKKQMKSK